jgi:hypothetical protein
MSHPFARYESVVQIQISILAFVEDVVHRNARLESQAIDSASSA